MIVLPLLLVGCTEKQPADEDIRSALPDPCDLVEASFLTAAFGGKETGPARSDDSTARSCSWHVSPATSKLYPQGAIFGVLVWRGGFGDEGTPEERVKKAKDFYASNTLHRNRTCTSIQSDSYDACWSYLPTMKSFAVDLQKGNVVVSAYIESFVGRRLSAEAQTAQRISEELAARI
ncbi:MAG TPA: hypothetical protein VFU43_07345 [Streptosporangiaceae bacterium]|nr:hypothetical protein [Streptosporangiaceae bacterium]